MRLGPYEITARIGAGGMGEVWRATDTNLGRQVAIKVLPDTFAHDPERLARFEREAKTLASLSHPNIAIIHGLEKTDGIRALVMELVEGPTLADRISQGRIPIDEALSMAKQIAEALEAAHEQGIIHRDLKPANIKLRPDGTVKVLDFGLAKAMEPLGATSPNVSESPTITTPAITQAGIILGTAAYMSPEQAKGRAADKRSDVWAFGCVLYETLAGRRAFDGEDMTEVLGAVVRLEPDWEALSSNVSPPVLTLLQSCLVKDRRHRVADISTALFVLEKAASLAAPVRTGSVVPLRRGPLWRRTVPWAATTVLGVALAVVLVLWAPWRVASPAAVVRLEVGIGADASLVTRSASLAVSPDGSYLAFVALNSQGATQLYVRRLGELPAVPLAGTANARDPFFSPDGLWMAFFADGQLRKVAVTGGAVVTLCAAPSDRGGAWAEDGSIVFQPTSSGSGLSRVPSSGGAPSPLSTLAGGEATHRWPQVLPGGKAVLYTAHTTATDFDNATLVVQPFPAGVPKVVHRGGYYGRYLRSGHLAYFHQGTLFAEPFDLARLEPTGPPVPVIGDISSYPGGGGGSSGSAVVAWTDGGTVMYVAQASAVDERPIQWMDRTGRVSSLRSTPGNWSNPSIAPDGGRLAYDMGLGQTDVWVYDLARDTPMRVTTDAAADQKPVWTPDGQRIVFRSSRDKSLNLYWQRADGVGDVQRLTESPNPQTPASWHPSGKFLAFYEVRQSNDLMILPMEGDEASGWKPGTPTVFLGTPESAEFEPMFSPDGRWIAYHSSESGRFEVYVRPFPGPGGQWRVSTDGGQFAIWSRARPEIVYQNRDNRLMGASYTVEGDTFKVDKPRLWSERRLMPRLGLRSFTLHPDGERVVLAVAPDADSVVKRDKLVFIFNFFDELRRIAPVNTRR